MTLESKTPKAHGVKPPVREDIIAPIFDRVLRKPRLEPGSKNSRDRETAIRKWLCIIGHAYGQLVDSAFMFRF